MACTVHLVSQNWAILTTPPTKQQNACSRISSRDDGAPDEGQPQRSPHCVVNPKVEQEAADCGNDEEGRHSKALETQGWDAVDGAQEEAKAVELGDEGAKLGGHNCQAAKSQGGAEEPGQGGGELACMATSAAWRWLSLRDVSAFRNGQGWYPLPALHSATGRSGAQPACRRREACSSQQVAAA